MKPNFINEHVISLIKKEITLKEKITKPTNFYYFNKPISHKSDLINRVGRLKPFIREEIIPTEWDKLSGKVLVDIYDKLKNNEFFFYKTIEGKTYKARLKKNVSK